MDDDQWRADGSFRGLAGSGASTGGRRKGGGGGGGGGAPRFNRVIPKFLQKYHEGGATAAPAIQAKFRQEVDNDDGDDGELDEMQQAAMDAYLAEKTRVKAVADSTGAPASENEQDEKDKRTRPSSNETLGKLTKAGGGVVKQRVAELGGPLRKKRKRVSEPKALCDKKLLSFSMDDDGDC